MANGTKFKVLSRPGTSNFVTTPFGTGLFFHFQKKVFVYYCGKFGFQKSIKREELQKLLKYQKIPFRIFICNFWDSGKILVNKAKICDLNKSFKGPKFPEPKSPLPRIEGPVPSHIFCPVPFRDFSSLHHASQWKSLQNFVNYSIPALKSSKFNKIFKLKNTFY